MRASLAATLPRKPAFAIWVWTIWGRTSRMTLVRARTAHASRRPDGRVGDQFWNLDGCLTVLLGEVGHRVLARTEGAAYQMGLVSEPGQPLVQQDHMLRRDRRC